MKNYIEMELNPAKVNLTIRQGKVISKSRRRTLSEVESVKVNYENALSVGDNNDVQIHLSNQIRVFLIIISIVACFHGRQIWIFNLQ